jgi:protein phosphatase
MKVKSFINLGKRRNQEDVSVFKNKTFIVCDGIGGHPEGEIASDFIANRVLDDIDKVSILNEQKIQQLLEKAQKDLINKLNKSYLHDGMGTTFAGVFFCDLAAYVTHIGDSRVYYLKPNDGQFWHTWDHSFISFLVQTREITREEGRFHPQNNRISKAIIANKDSKTVKADITTLTNIDKGDLFFICSDGVNEAWSDIELIRLLFSKKSIIEKLNTIREKCVADSKDNNSAILLEVEEQDIISGSNNSINMFTLEDLEIDYRNYLKNKKS